MPVYDPITDRTWLDPHEAATYLGKSFRWLTSQIAYGHIKPHKRGGTNVFLLSELEEYEAAHAPREASRTPRAVAERPRKNKKRKRAA